MPSSKILLCGPVAPADLERAKRAFPQYRWEASSRAPSAEALADAEIVYGAPKEETLTQAKNLKWCQHTSAGVEKLARSDFFLRSSFTLTNASGMHDSCAEHAIALLLGFTRRIAFHAKSDRAVFWAGHKVAPVAEVLCGKTLGVLGLGFIGRRIARIARGIGMKTIGVSFSGRPVAEADETHPVSALDALLPRFDAVVLVLPATPQTDRLLNAARLAKLPRHAVLVNVGRGNAIDEMALVAALKEGRLAGAALDVFDREPLSPDSPLFGLPNVVLTPHIGGHRPDYDARAFAIFLENLTLYAQGKPLHNSVDRDRRY